MGCLHVLPPAACSAGSGPAVSRTRPPPQARSATAPKPDHTPGPHPAFGPQLWVWVQPAWRPRRTAASAGRRRSTWPGQAPAPAQNRQFRGFPEEPFRTQLCFPFHCSGKKGHCWFTGTNDSIALKASIQTVCCSVSSSECSQFLWPLGWTFTNSNMRKMSFEAVIILHRLMCSSCSSYK